MTRKAVWSAMVERDLENITDYIALRDARAATRFLHAVEKAFQRLAEFPELGARWEEFETSIPGLRFWPLPRYRNYVVFYRILPNGVQIVRVADGRRDFPSLFG